MKKLTLFAMLALTTTMLGQEKLFSGNWGTYTMSIFKVSSSETPYQITVNPRNDVARQFSVIRYTSDIFSYLIVENKQSETIYYPLVWADLKAITVTEIKQRCISILSGDIPSIPRTSL